MIVKTTVSGLVHNHSLIFSQILTEGILQVPGAALHSSAGVGWVRGAGAWGLQSGTCSGAQGKQRRSISTLHRAAERAKEKSQTGQEVHWRWSSLGARR